MKPPDEPNPGKAGEIAERLFVVLVGQEFEDIVLGQLLRGLVQGLKLHLFAGADVADGLEREFGHAGIFLGPGPRAVEGGVLGDYCRDAGLTQGRV